MGGLYFDRYWANIIKVILNVLFMRGVNRIAVVAICDKLVNARCEST